MEVRIGRPDNKVRLQFIDQGPGIRPEDQEKIFEPFYRARSTEKKEGSGLGLFLARRIIEIHRGTISASTNQPTGTIISVELPAL